MTRRQRREKTRRINANRKALRWVAALVRRWGDAVAEHMPKELRP